MNTNINLKPQFVQAAELIKKAKNILLIPHAKMDCDGMSSAIALYQILKTLGKNPTAVCTDPVPEAFRFLPHANVFRTDIEKPKDKNSFLITVDSSKKGFKNLEYEVQDGKVNILIASGNDPFEDTDFSFVSGNMEPDLIITLDSGDIQQLGKIYEDNLELFSRVPVLNMDHHISNTNFGTMNLVEMKNASTTEVIWDLLPYLDDRGHNLVDEDIATLLLAGMITDTGSFQHSNTTPKVLDSAAELIEKGARQQEIIKHLFKTKSLATLRLWGRVLTKLKNDPIYRIVWSSVSTEDLQESLAHSDDTEGLIDELLATTPGTEMVLLVKEREDGMISTSVRTSSSLVDAVKFTEQFGGGGHRQAAGFKIRERGGKSFDEIVSDIVFSAKNFQSNRLGVTPPVANIMNIPQIELPQTQLPNEELHIQTPLIIPESSIPELPETEEIPQEKRPPFEIENIKNSSEPQNFSQEIPSQSPVESPVESQAEEKEKSTENNKENNKENNHESGNKNGDEKIISSFGDILSMDHNINTEISNFNDHSTQLETTQNIEPQSAVVPEPRENNIEYHTESPDTGFADIFAEHSQENIPDQNGFGVGEENIQNPSPMEIHREEPFPIGEQEIQPQENSVLQENFQPEPVADPQIPFIPEVSDELETPDFIDTVEEEQIQSPEVLQREETPQSFEDSSVSPESHPPVDDEFALFLSRAKEKKDDIYHDSSFATPPDTSPVDNEDAKNSEEEEDPFLASLEHDYSDSPEENKS